ncbi:MAG: sulfoxide reductase heme-binding subunit YedZ [Ardenticatenaceae bacterium]|nr:sulfoxide reductase heme-binding subunit YedZ [Ardenticatenaceae bacterium]MCB8990491.1 sulfoxide reductase heme-binding subunit YedZ [Ardenticatenaceae bacterium]
MMKLDRKTKANILRWTAHVVALLPLAIIIWRYYTGQLTADPIRDITLRTGWAAIVLLVASLACTPLNIVFGWKQVLPLRRPLGLYAFLYVSLHLLTFVYLDYGLVWGLIQEAIFDKRYALVGLAAFLILLPLALTSSKWSMRKLGKNWKRLHKWVYLAGVLAVVHYFWLVKNVYTQPIIFAVILGGLLLLRVSPVKQQVIRWRQAARKRLRVLTTS